MSRFFPHTAYAEDQPLSKTILTTHVMARAVTTGTVIGSAIYGTKKIFGRKTPTISATSSSRAAVRAFIPNVGVTTAYTLGIVGTGLVFRMWGREEIEWKDRSWRLMENKGQLECDDWTYASMAVGLAAGVVMLRRGRVPPSGMLGGGSGATLPAATSMESPTAVVLGTVSIASFGGMVGYMGYRYGIKGGKFD